LGFGFGFGFGAGVGFAVGVGFGFERGAGREAGTGGGATAGPAAGGAALGAPVERDAGWVGCGFVVTWRRVAGLEAPPPAGVSTAWLPECVGGGAGLTMMGGS
jgi:hypothetical protein